MNWSCEHVHSRINQSIATDCRTLQPHDEGVLDQTSYHIAIDWLILLHKCSSRSICQLSQRSNELLLYHIQCWMFSLWQCWLALHALLVVCSVQHWLTCTKLYIWNVIVCELMTCQWLYIFWLIVRDMRPFLIPAAHSSVQLCFQDSSQHS